MENFYKDHSRHFLAVDCIIFGYEKQTLKLLLYRRDFEPSRGSWSLIGGFVRSDESCEAAAQRILHKTTGLQNIYMDQVAVFSDPSRESVARVVSVAFVALININEHNPASDLVGETLWWPITHLPKMVFDHSEMVELALRQLQQKAGYSLAGAELLPEMFTMKQLRSLYEAIYLRKFDAGNFRKKMLSLNILERLDQKDFTSSRKGAHYYRLKPESMATEINRIVKF